MDSIPHLGDIANARPPWVLANAMDELLSVWWLRDPVSRRAALVENQLSGPTPTADQTVAADEDKEPLARRELTTASGRGTIAAAYQEPRAVRAFG
jgi:hypothetical protein